ncbi:hypothetical protein BC629DRAFT_753168 [Irpex lacteus]|nr:hypothetical protein BC629DRAFT_753168 [Irpex lacteus]
MTSTCSPGMLGRPSVHLVSRSLIDLNHDTSLGHCDCPPITSRSSSIAPPTPSCTPTKINRETLVAILLDLTQVPQRDVPLDTSRSNGQCVWRLQAGMYCGMYARGSVNCDDRGSPAKCLNPARRSPTQAFRKCCGSSGFAGATTHCVLRNDSARVG